METANLNSLVIQLLVFEYFNSMQILIFFK